MNLLWEKSILNQVKPIFNPDYSEINLFPSLIIHREQRKFLDSHSLQGQTGSYSRKIKWFAPISFQRIWAVICSGTIFLLFLVCSADFDMLLSGLFSHHDKFYSSMFTHKISTRVVWVW